MAVHAEQAVRKQQCRGATRFRPNHAGQIFQIDLMANPHAGRQDAQILERLLTPFEETVALLVAGEFVRHILPQRVRHARNIDHDRMVDDEVERHRRIDRPWIAAEPHHRVAHRGQIRQQRHAGRIRHHHASRMKVDLVPAPAGVGPGAQREDIVPGHGDAILMPQQIL